MLSLPNIALRHGKITGSNRVMYPLNNDPIVQNRLYWNEEFDEEFLQANGNNKKTNNMNTSSKLPDFTKGASTSQPYAMATGGTSYYDPELAKQTNNFLFGVFKSLGLKGFQDQSQQPTSTYTPPPPPPTTPEKGWSTGAIIGVSVAGAAILGLGIWAVVRATRG